MRQRYRRGQDRLLRICSDILRSLRLTAIVPIVDIEFESRGFDRFIIEQQPTGLHILLAISVVWAGVADLPSVRTLIAPRKAHSQRIAQRTTDIPFCVYLVKAPVGQIEASLKIFGGLGSDVIDCSTGGILSE